MRFAKFMAVLLVFPYALSLIYAFTYPPSTLMLSDWLRFEKVQRDWVELEHISPNLINAVIASEDDAFCEHHGMDFTQMQKSIEKAERNGSAVKATSTITQQTVKNLFLWQGRSWARKILEAPLTFWLELTWSKHRILETYLNIAQWGDNIYGAGAAARVNFGTDAGRLSMAQSALLATSLPNPIARNAGKPGSGQLLLEAQLLSRLMKNRPDISCLQ